MIWTLNSEISYGRWEARGEVMNHKSKTVKSAGRLKEKRIANLVMIIIKWKANRAPNFPYDHASLYLTSLPGLSCCSNFDFTSGNYFYCFIILFTSIFFLLYRHVIGAIRYLTSTVTSYVADIIASSKYCTTSHHHLG